MTASTPETPGDATQVVGPSGSVTNGDQTTVASKEEESTRARQFNLLGIHGPYIGKNFRLAPPQTRVGRVAEYNDIVLDRDTTVSKRHCTFFLRQNRLFVQDSESTKGTFVNKKTLKGGPEFEVKPGDELWIGKSIFRAIEGKRWDFRPPMKTGFFHTRIKWPAAALLVLLVLGAGGYTIVTSWLRIAASKARPDPLEITQGGWPISIPGVDSLYPVMTAGDLDGDGIAELIIVSRTGDLLAHSMVKGGPLWRSVRLEGEPSSNPVLADMNGDGVSDIILSVRWRTGMSEFLVVYDGANGMEITRSPNLGGATVGTPAVADLDGDLEPEIVASVIGNNPIEGPKVWRGKRSGPSEWGWTHQEIQKTRGSMRTIGMPVVTDVESDGIPEVLVLTDDGRLMGYDVALSPRLGSMGQDLTGPMKSRLRGGATAPVFRGPVSVGDMDGDGVRDVAMASMYNEYCVLAGPGFTSALWADIQQSALVEYPDRVPAPVVFDYDRDGKDDVAVVTHGGEVRVYRGEGDGAGNPRILWREKLELPWDELSADMAAVDIDNDGTPEILLTTTKGNLFILDPAPGAPTPRLARYEGLGSVVVAGDVGLARRFTLLLSGAEGGVFELLTNTAVPPGFVPWSGPGGNNRNTGRPGLPPSVRHFEERIVMAISAMLIIGITVAVLFLRRLRRVRGGAVA